MAKDYIPGPHLDFNDFQNNLVDMVEENASTWGIAAGKVTALTEAQGVYQPFYNAVANRATASKAGRASHQAARKTYQSFLRQFVKEHLVHNSSISAGDKKEMGINTGLRAPSVRPAITTAPHILLKPLGNLTMQFEFRVEGDSNRPSLHPHCDAIELRIAISSKAPASYHEVPGHVPVKRARIKRIFDDPDYRGKHIYVFARWANLSDENKSGPWSNMAGTMIS